MNTSEKEEVTLAEQEHLTPLRRQNLNKCNQVSFVRYSQGIWVGAKSERIN